VKSVAWLVATLTLVAAGVYTVVSLARWEWNRALFFALVFVAAEVGLAAALVLHRLARVESLVIDATARDGGARQALRDTRGEQVRFAWLRVDPTDVVGRTSVFITLLVGGGVILSGGAWLIDKLAANTVDPRFEQRLGRELDAIAYRPGLLVDEVDVLARPSLDRDDPRVRSFLDPHR
jgi:hypothetical protein